MTLQELYARIGGDYEQATRVLRVDRLVDKHIRRLVKNGVVDSLITAGESMESVQLFERAHAMKGVCANLGLTKLADAASDIAEEYRPGSSRTMSDAEVKERIQAIAQLYQQTKEGIRQYEGAAQ